MRRAVRETAPGDEVVEVGGLRDGGSPWRLTLRSGRVVVRTGTVNNAHGHYI